MSNQNRTALAEILPVLLDDREHPFLFDDGEFARVREKTAEPLYALPGQLVELISRHLPGLLSTADREREIRFTSICKEEGALGLFLGYPIVHGLLSREPVLKLTSALHEFSGLSEYMSLATAQESLRQAEELLEPAIARMEAYLGWLVTNPEFVNERNALRVRRGDFVALLGMIPQRVAGTEGRRIGEQSTVSHSMVEESLADFTTFYSRWELSGLATWDLPSPIGVNLGGSASIGRLIGVEQSPTIQVPPTLRLPDRFPLDRLVRGSLPKHLSEWEQVQEQRHPDDLSYSRLKRILHLHFLRNNVLRSRYGDRFRRRTQQLDALFADHFGDSDDQTIRKTRRWVERRLNPR